ncbi:hypothetical protein ACFLYS_00135 [Chloroflexota bacterium]
MISYRVWLFRILAAVAAGLMITSFIMPWWTANFEHFTESHPEAIRIYAHGLQHSLGDYSYFVYSDITPQYQTILAWAFLAVSAGLILFSIWLKGNKGRWLLGGVGLIYIAYTAIAAFVVISGRLSEFGISLQGWSTIEIIVEGTEAISDQIISVLANLRFGYYLAYIAGAICILSALFRNIITGKPKTVT